MINFSIQEEPDFKFESFILANDAKLIEQNESTKFYAFRKTHQPLYFNLLGEDELEIYHDADKVHLSYTGLIPANQKFAELLIAHLDF
ncbi:MAG: hypothetical protein AB1540_17540 [Bdellovibrionota bacterium]